MKESDLVRKIIAAVKAKYPKAYVRKLSDRFTRGIPDVLILFQWSPLRTEKHKKLATFGGSLLIETKVKKSKLSALQQIEQNEIVSAGSQAIVAFDVETVMAKLEEMGAV